MKAERVPLLLTYTMIAVLIGSTILGFVYRGHNAAWAEMPDVRWNYDFFGIMVVALALVVAGGLWFRREWGRTLALSLCFIVFFMFLGIRLLAPFLVGLPFGSSVNVASVLVGCFAVATAFALTRPRFKAYYSGSSSHPSNAP
jgi:hypothetical protein